MLFTLYIISLTIFGDPRIVVLDFLFSLLFVPMGAVFCRRLVLTLAVEQEKVSRNPMIQLKNIELLLHFRLRGYVVGRYGTDNANVV